MDYEPKWAGKLLLEITRVPLLNNHFGREVRSPNGSEGEQDAGPASNCRVPALLLERRG
jgi:hypothetical protein